MNSSHFDLALEMRRIKGTSIVAGKNLKILGFACELWYLLLKFRSSFLMK